MANPDHIPARIYKGKPTKAQWLADVARSDHGRDCVEWPYAKGRGGYGNLIFMGKYSNAHRVVCELAYGPAPSADHHAAHECGNRSCINPHHLSWKTPSENNLDKERHGTTRRGDKSNLAKLTRDDVERVRRLKAENPSLSYKELGKLAGVGRGNAWLIATGRTWSD